MLLAACGGGGNDSDNPTPPPAPGTVTLSGTAATAAAIAIGTIDAKCQGATGSAKTTATGTYSLKIDGASLPCMVRVTSADNNTILHSVADGTGSGTPTANVTPFTELIVTKAAGGSAASLYSIYDASTQSLLAAGKLAEARTLLTDALKTAGIDITGSDPLKDAFVVGDAKGTKIAELETKLTEGKTTVSDLGNALLNGSGTQAAETVTAALTAPPVANCPAVRSVAYRVVATDGSSQLVHPNFATGVVSANQTITFSSATTCQADVATGGLTQQGQFASSGLLLTTTPAAAGKNATIVVGFPEQTIPLADLAGTWNTVEMSKENQSLVNYYAVLDITAQGVVAISDCNGLGACVPASGKGSIAAAQGGGYTLRTPEGDTGQMFAFRGSNGKIMLAVVFNDSDEGSMVLASQQAVLALPTVGTVNPSWDVQLSTGAVTTVTASDSVQTITAVNTATSTVTRQRNDGRIDSLVYNSPRNGLRQRLAGSFNGTNFGGLIQLPTGLGITAYGGVTNGQFGVSINK